MGTSGFAAVATRASFDSTLGLLILRDRPPASKPGAAARPLWAGLRQIDAGERGPTRGQPHHGQAPGTAHLDATPLGKPPAAEQANGKVLTLDELERAHIERVFALAKGHKGRTCELLGISRPTLERKLKKYGLTSANEE